MTIGHSQLTQIIDSVFSRISIPNTIQFNSFFSVRFHNRYVLAAIKHFQHHQSLPLFPVIIIGIHIVYGKFILSNCSQCGQSLGQSRSCYIRNGRIYCKDDNCRLMKKCSKCNRTISANDWVRRAGMLVYHLACFACDLCQRQLSTGEKFTLEKQQQQQQHHPNNNQLSPLSSTNSNSTISQQQSSLSYLATAATNHHHQHNRHQQTLTIITSESSNGHNQSTPPTSTNIRSNSSLSSSSSSNNNNNNSNSNNNNSKTKRVRTTFTEDQLSILQANFQQDSNPDGQDLERIATLTGLSKRVTQVWFQNSRARQKKFMNKSTISSTSHHHHHHHTHPVIQVSHPQQQPPSSARHANSFDSTQSSSLLINCQQQQQSNGNVVQVAKMI
ncbi:Arrowhead-like protein [Euroglyphus maynei]|uniref:Arrowhead-like protein n=1 Tax=Euroglyphus maynei TaxID=6958 RepID=A0A1Y3BKR6_EURMA|nr:Arrowhead-like protein [Euroglyphus maynei]